ncbi:acriflavin resistance protein [Afipia sp. P52-10]|nr:acriflavin resistance protein [Afipia sp. P52-10]
MGGCQDQAAPPQTPMSVVTEVATLSDYSPTVSLTGEVKARIQNDLSFRVSGKLIERKVDVGSRVKAGDLLAKIDPQEQIANLNAAQASVEASQASLKQATATFERQKTLLEGGYTTRRDYDQAEQVFKTAQGSMDSANAQLATARDQLGYTELHASASGVITARNAEVGQIVQAAQAIFTLAQDGALDAVFNINELILTREPGDPTIELTLVSDPSVRASGTVREISPTIDPQMGTIRVKVTINDPPPAMALGAAVVGSGKFKARSRIVLPASALFSHDGRPAVWVVDPQSKAASLKPITVDAFETQHIVVRDGLKPGDIVVTRGAYLLRPDQIVALAGSAKP